MALTNDMGAIIGFALETLFYGFYCMLFLASSTVLLWWRPKHRGYNVPMLVANFVLFLCCTTHFALEFNHFYATLAATGVPGYANERKPLIDLLIPLTYIFGDFVLIYRCWHVWGQNYYVIILPSILAMAYFVCFCEVLHLMLSINPAAPVAPPSTFPLSNAAYALSLCANGIVTILIVGRIWWSSRIIREISPLVRASSSGDPIRRAMIIVSESGSLYLATQLVFVVLHIIQHPALAIVGVVSVQICGIAPTIIIIGVELGFKSDEMMSQATINLDFGKSTSRRPTSTPPTTTKTSAHAGTTAADSDGEFMGDEVVAAEETG